MSVRRIVHPNIILFILALAQFMVVLDTSIVNVALPHIFSGLKFSSAADLQWVVTAYTLAFGGFLLLGGRAADLFGRKKMFLYAVGAFSVLSLFCGLAQNSVQIEIARAMQGLAAAFLSPAALSIVLTTFKEGKERNAALSVWGAVAAGGAAAGLLLGGVLTQYLNWRWNFFVNVPVGIGVFIATLFYVPESKADLDHKKLDLPGAILATTGLMLLVFGFTKAPQYGWLDVKTLGILGASLVLLISFIINEGWSKHALMPLKFFKIRNVLGANLMQMPITASLFAMFFFLSLYVQNVLGYSPVKTGLSFLPITVVIGITSIIASKIIGKIGYKIPMSIAPLFLSGALFWLAHLPVHGNYWTQILPPLILMALGMGITFISITIAATTGVPHRESGLASGILNTAQQIGGALGLAILSGIGASAASSYVKSHIMGLGAAPTNEAAKQLMVAAQVHGYHYAFYVGAGFALLASILAITMIHQVKGEKIDPSAATPL